jgi:plastocyanin
MPVPPRRSGPVPLLLALLLTAGCGGDNGSGPSEPVRVAKPEVDSGDGQEGIVSFELNNPLRVRITRNDRPVADVPVTWSTEDGGEMNPSVTVSNEAGIAESQWILGPGGGNQSAVATVPDGDGSPVTFTAHALVLQEPSTTTVQVLDNEFSPRNLTVRVGRAVTWVWAEGGNAHNLVPTDGLRPEQSGPPVPGPHTFVYQFNTPGVYTYYCEVHGSPNGTGMAGTITVTDVSD